MKVIQVRWPGSPFGMNFQAETPEQALEMHRVFYARTVTDETAYQGRTTVEHVGNMLHYCSACHFYPCTHQGQ